MVLPDMPTPTLFSYSLRFHLPPLKIGLAGLPVTADTGRRQELFAFNKAGQERLPPAIRSRQPFQLKPGRSCYPPASSLAPMFSPFWLRLPDSSSYQLVCQNSLLFILHLG